MFILNYTLIRNSRTPEKTFICVYFWLFLSIRFFTHSYWLYRILEDNLRNSRCIKIQVRFYKEFDNIVWTEEAKNCKKRRVQKNPDPNARALQFTLPSLKMLRPLEVLKDIETRKPFFSPLQYWTLKKIAPIRNIINKSCYVFYNAMYTSSI